MVLIGSLGLLLVDVLKLAQKTGMAVEQLLNLNSSDHINRDVGSDLFEASMNVDGGFYRPTDMTEPLQGGELRPLRALCVVHLEGNNLTDRIGSASNHEHQWT